MILVSTRRSPCLRDAPRLALLRKLESRDEVAMHLVRAFPDSHGTLICIHLGKRALVRDPEAAEKLNRPIEHRERHVRRQDLALRDLGAGGLHPVLLDEPRRAHDIGAELIDFHSRSSDGIGEYLAARKLLAGNHALVAPFANLVQTALRCTQRSHAESDAPYAD